MQTPYPKTDWSEKLRDRAPVVLLFMAAALAVLFFRLFQLQVVHGDEYRRISENNAIRIHSLAPTRGLIVDRNGVILADNRPAFDVYVVPRDARPTDEVAILLGRFLGLDPADLEKRIHKGLAAAPYRPILVAGDIDRDALGILEANRMDLPGVTVSVESRRHYPLGPVAAHLAGYVGQISARELASGRFPDRKSGDYVGKCGVESRFEDELLGKSGGRQVEVDAKGRVVSVLYTLPATPGDTLVLTLDSRLQEKAMELMEGESGAVVAIEPSTGRVLVLLSTPAYDPNWFVDGMSAETWNSLASNPHKPLQNKAVSGAYPPGSTYKIVAAMAALEEGVVTPDTRIFCPGHYELGDREFWCWKKTGHGQTGLVQSLTESCDVYYYKVGQELGVDRLAWYAQASGLGRRTGISLDNEARGLVPTAAWKQRRYHRPWVGGETLSVAIGQGFNLATPLQMACLTAAVANGGTRYRPRIVEKIVAADGSLVAGFQPETVGRLPVSATNLWWIKRGLWGVVHDARGTARAAQAPGVEISGKTGTAQVVGRKDRDQFLNETSDKRMFEDHAWFVAYWTPPDREGIAVCVLVEHGGHGSSVAAPIARDLIVEYARLQEEELGSLLAETAGGTVP